MRLKLGGFFVLLGTVLFVGFHLLIGIQVNDAHGLPVACGAAPALCIEPSLAAASHGLRFSLSHTRGWVAVAVATQHEVGVDVESLRPDVAIREVAQVALTRTEYTAWDQLPQTLKTPLFAQVWTLKESVLKAYGVGIGLHLPSLCVQLEDGAIRSVHRVHPDAKDWPNGIAQVVTWDNQNALAVTCLCPAEAAKTIRLFDLSSARIHFSPTLPLIGGS